MLQNVEILARPGPLIPRLDVKSYLPSSEIGALRALRADR